MIKLIVNADDFGYSNGVNYAVVDTYKNGILNSATMMMNMPGTEHAIKLAKEHYGLQVGIHLVLTCGKPLLNDVKSLVDENGYFKKLSYLKQHKDFSLDDLEREWTAQIEKFLASGLVPTHFDSHHHTHGIKEIQPLTKKLSEKYNLPVRQSVIDKMDGVNPFTDVFLSDFYGETATYDYFEKLEQRVKDGQTVEVMCHPAYLDNEVLTGSSYNLDRIKETDILINAKLPKKFILL